MNNLLETILFLSIVCNYYLLFIYVFQLSMLLQFYSVIFITFKVFVHDVF